MAWLPLSKEFDPDFTIPGRKPVGPVLPEVEKISVGNASASWFHLGNPSRPNNAFFDGAKLNLINGARINPRGIYFDGSNDYATFTNDPTLDAVVSGDFTIHMRLATPNPSQTNTYVINADPNRWNIIYGFNTRTYETFWDTGTFRRTIATLDADDTGYHVISCRRRGNLITVFFDGIPVINEIGTTSSLGGTWRLGTSTGLADFWNGTVSDLLFVDGAQSDAFCRSFGKNPYDYLRPANDPIAFFGGAPQVPTITASQQEEGDATSATVTPIINITANQQEGGDAQSANVVTPAIVTANLIEEGDTQTANFPQPGSTITANQQEAGDTTSATVVPLIKINANLVEEGDTQSALFPGPAQTVITANQQEAGDSTVATILPAVIINANQVEGPDQAPPITTPTRRAIIQPTIRRSIGDGTIIQGTVF